MLAEISGDFRPVNQGAVDTAPEPLSPFRLDELAEFWVLAGVEGAEAVGAVLALKMVTWVVLALAGFDVDHGLVCSSSDPAGIVGDQAVGPKPLHPAGLIRIVYRPGIDL